MAENNEITTRIIQLKRGTAAALATVNPKPLAGEVITETDTGKMKVGDGTRSYNDLPYVDAGNVKETAISTEAATDGKFSTTAAENDATTLVTMSQLRVLQEGIDGATHEVSSLVASASGATLPAGANDSETGTSLEASKAMNNRIKALEDVTTIDGGEITAA